MTRKNSLSLFRSFSVITFCLFLFEFASGQTIIPIFHSYCGELVHHKYYTLSYLEEHEQAEWVTYSIGPDFLKSNANRSNKFKEDPLVSTGSAKLSDYVGSGFDRGHLVPAGDMTFSNEAMNESFYMSNISPQDPSFNRGIWKKLETQVRAWGNKFKIIVVTGGVFTENTNTTIGNSEVTVPREFFKIIYAPKNGEMIGFLIPNEKLNVELISLLKTVDEIETITGTNYFENLPEELQKQLESQINMNFWRLSTLD